MTEPVGIFQVRANGSILNLSPYRGLEIIDVSEPARPRIVGELRLEGLPIAVHPSGDRIYVLLESTCQYGRDLSLKSGGSLVVAIDISDEAAPRSIGFAPVPGQILSSRLTVGLASEALYLVATTETRTFAASFEISSEGLLQPKEVLELSDAEAAAARATSAGLVVATTNGVILVDISDVSGSMRASAPIPVQGEVVRGADLGVSRGILCVFSGRNELATFDVSNLAEPQPIDHVSFGGNEERFSSEILDGKAFAITARGTETAYAFAIDEAGSILRKPDRVISGANTILHPLQDQQRAIGVEVGNDGLTVSLVDLDLDAPAPLLALQQIQLPSEWAYISSWEESGPTVLEDATAVTAPTGELETGMVIVTAHGFDEELSTPLSRLTLFTFSATTLTARGSMEHDSHALRSFVAKERVISSLSADKLVLFDLARPDEPTLAGAIEVAPNYVQVLHFGSYSVRRHRFGHRNWNERADDVLEIVDASAGLETTEPLAQIAISADAIVNQIGDKLTVATWVFKERGPDGPEYVPPIYTTTIDLYSMSDPTAPVRLGSLTTEALPGSIHTDPRRATGPGQFDVYGDWAWGRRLIRSTDSALVFAGARRSQFELYFVDVRGDEPVLTTLAMPPDEMPVSLLLSGSQLYLSYGLPYVGDDSRKYARYYFKHIDLTDPTSPTVSKGINVPGEVIGVHGDLIFTHDHLYGEYEIESAVARVRLRGDRAKLEAVRRYEGRSAEILFDDRGYALVTDKVPSSQATPEAYRLFPTKMRILDLKGEELPVRAEFTVRTRMAPKWARDGRALFWVSQGVLLLNTEDVTAPFAQDFVWMVGVPGDVEVYDDRIYLSSGLFGIQQFDLDADRLTP